MRLGAEPYTPASVFPLERLLIPHWAAQALRVAFVLYLFASLWIVGRYVGRLVRLAVPEPFAEWLIEIGLGFGAVSLAVRCLGAVGLAVRELLLGLLLVPALLLLWMQRRGSLPQFSLPRVQMKWPLAVLAFLPLPMALAPAVSYDSLVYQLRFPEMTLWTGRWAIDSANSHSFFPAASETLYLFGLSVDSSGICAQLIHYGFFLLTLAALIALGRSVAAVAGEVAALLFASIPAAGIVAGWSWSDMTLCFALLASGLALLYGEVGPAMAMLGLAAAIKYSGLLLSLPLAGAAILSGVRTRRIGALLGGAGAGALVAAPWYVGNWLRVGNPVYPLLPGIFGGPGETAGRILDWSGSSKASWVTYFVRPDTLDGDVGGVVLTIAVLAALLFCFVTRRHLGPATIVLLSFATLLAFAPSARILLPPIAGGCLLAGFAAVEQRKRAGARWPLALAGVLAARGAFLIAAHNALFFNPVPCAVGIEKPEDYRLRNFAPAPLFERAGAKIPARALVLVFGESRLFHFPRPTVASTRVDPPAVLPFLRGAPGPDDVVSRLRRRGITHLLVSLDALRPTQEALVWQRGLSPVELATFSRTVQRCRPLDRQGPLLLLELPQPSGGGRPVPS